jgi:hypothetical protein
MRCHVDEPRGLEHYLEPELAGIEIPALGQFARYDNGIGRLHLHKNVLPLFCFGMYFRGRDHAYGNQGNSEKHGK